MSAKSTDKCPKKVDVGPFSFKIVFGETKLTEYRRAGDNDSLGVTLIDRKVMYIGDDRPLQAVKDTVHHEVVHCIINTFGIIVPHYKDDVTPAEDYDKEERFVAAFSTAYLDTALRNPKLFGWLFSRSNKEA